MSTDVAATAGTRPRPTIHFTADDGWINDPYGIRWHDGRYHLYFQAVPGEVTWRPNCHWGHATSTDLVHWRETDMALVPQPFEVGCWSGCVVYDDPEPVLFYTRILEDHPDLGRVAVAHRDPTIVGGWRTDESDVVIAAPPAGAGVRVCRDPFILRRPGGGWAMLLGVALDDGRAGVLQYHSADLRTWSCDGLLAARPNDRADEVWTGALWECPQLFPLGDEWVLLVSIWDDTSLHYVAAAVGSYDGTVFHPRRWQRLTYGNSAYAMTAFQDREGRPCVMSWLREEPQNNDRLSERAGAHSIAAVVTMSDDGQLLLTPHPAVEAVREEVRTGDPESGRMVVESMDAAIGVVISATEELRCELFGDDEQRLQVTWSAERGGQLVLRRPGFDTETQPVAPETSVQLLVDADLVEVFASSTYGAYRVRPLVDRRSGLLSLEAPSAANAVSTYRTETPNQEEER